MKANGAEQSEHINAFRSLQREIGTYGSHQLGPTLICVCGLHGNEPSSLQAFQKVMDHLNASKPQLQGSLIGLAGNLSALRQGVRFLKEDLNRIWTHPRVAGILEGAIPIDPSHAEEREQRELLTSLWEIFNQSRQPIYVLDLHTTSSTSQPFITINDTIRNRDFAQNFPFPIVLGIEEFLEGTLLSYINELGHIALGFEAGQHQDPMSIIWHEMTIWLALEKSGIFHSSWPTTPREKYVSLPHTKQAIYEVRYRREVTPDENFKMTPGYQNFDPVRKDAVIASNNSGPIQVPESGKILMPLYQKEGEDAFFIVRSIIPLWLKISKWMRRVQLHQVLPWLPGITKHKDQEHELLVNTTIARWFVVEIFHLMGYRRKKMLGNKLLFCRRKYDFKGPQPSEDLLIDEE